MLHKVIQNRIEAGLEPLKCLLTKRSEETNRKCTVKGKVLEYYPLLQRYLIQEIGETVNEKFLSNRLCVRFVDFETDGDLDMRRMKGMALQKASFLRMNIERILFSEMLKLRPELRPAPQQVNRLEKLIDLPRLEKIRKNHGHGPLEPSRIRKVVELAESVYVSS